MKISVKLIATYRELLPEGTQGNKIEIDVPEGTKVSDIMAQFDVPQDDSSVIVVNGLTVTLSTILVEGDEVSAFSAIAGG
ncbi:MAG: MoaD/ThiS family protein [Chloroflexi bacterium]|nr:MoaD/ThiS family protein [Chloroflexota bacterium]